MGTIRKTLTFTDQQNQWIKSKISQGEFTNESEYVRHLVRQDQEQQAKIKDLKAAIAKGKESGTSELQIPEIMRAVETRLKSDG